MNAQTTCIDCGSPIPLKRLLAIRDAERCVACQSGVDELLVASPNLSASEEEVNGADFLIVRRRARQSDELMGELP